MTEPYHLARLCYAAHKRGLPLERSFGVVRTVFGESWPFGPPARYRTAMRGNKLRVYAATLLSLIVCTDQEPTDD